MICTPCPRQTTIRCACMNFELRLTQGIFPTTMSYVSSIIAICKHQVLLLLPERATAPSPPCWCSMNACGDGHESPVCHAWVLYCRMHCIAHGCSMALQAARAQNVCALELRISCTATILATAAHFTSMKVPSHELMKPRFISPGLRGPGTLGA